MKSYFFIPANQTKFLSKADQIDADHIILDLEDAIFNTSLESAVDNILSLDLSRTYFIRLAWPTDDVGYIKQLIDAGFRKFFLPKMRTISDLEKFIAQMNPGKEQELDLDLKVLVENPEALYNLAAFLKYPYVTGVNFGSHDYCNETGMEYNTDNFYWHRMQLLNTAKAFGKEAIDTASMDLSDESAFIAECKDGISKGFDGKFLIHPWQLKLFNEIAHYSDDEIEFAKKVKAHIDELGGISKFSLAQIDGRVVEKPHLKRMNQILKSFGYDTI